MSKILIVTDTTSSLTFEQAKALNIELVPLTIIIDDVAYVDQKELSGTALMEQLAKGAVPSTSQPNIGMVEEMMSEWKNENYDAIIIITISAKLSGTHNGFQLIANQLEMNNVFVVDSKTVAGPLIEGAKTARAMADQGASVNEILAVLEKGFNSTRTFIYPKTLDQLKKGGRISPIAATMSSLLKIKPLLHIETDGSAVGKFGIAKTDNKIHDMMFEAFKTQGVSADTHKIYLEHSSVEEDVMKTKKFFESKFEGIEIEVVQLPAVLMSHGGLGCLGVQSVLKK